MAVAYDVFRVRDILTQIWVNVATDLNLPRGEKARAGARERYLRKAWRAIDAGEVERATEYWPEDVRAEALRDDECIALIAAGLAIEACGYGWSEPFAEEARALARERAFLRALREASLA